MCTSFVSRNSGTMIGMNFDNNGMKYSISKKHNDWFVVYVNGGKGSYPSFGVDKLGRFFNNLVVDSNGKGLYRRPSVNVTHTTKLITDVLNKTIICEELSAYLDSVEIVNTPDWSCHNMVIDSEANVWIIEPGRGNIFSGATESPFVVMTNTSVVDMGTDAGAAVCDRYRTASDMLSRKEEMSVDDAFEILERVCQSSGEWKTDLSFVYSKEKQTVYYCYNREFATRHEHRFD